MSKRMESKVVRVQTQGKGHHFQEGPGFASSVTTPDLVLIRNNGELLSRGIALIIALRAWTGHNTEFASCGS